MLAGITLENFKAFKSPQFIPIRPITLVFGPNSAGKSSIMHALAFLKYVNDSNGHCEPDVVDYGWDKIYLGPWQNLVNGHDLNATMRITLHFNGFAIGWDFKNCAYGPRVNSFDFYDEDKLIARGTNTKKDHKNPAIHWEVELHSDHPFWIEYQKALLGIASGDYVVNAEASEIAQESGIASDGELCEIFRDPSKENFNRYHKDILLGFFKEWIGADSWKKLPHENNIYKMTSLFPCTGDIFDDSEFTFFWPPKSDCDTSPPVHDDRDSIF